MFSLSEGNIIMGYWCRIIYDCQVITSNQIWANNTFQYIFKSRWSTLTISLGEYFYDIPFPEVSAFNHNIKKYNRYIVIWYVRKQYDNMVMIHLYHSWTVLIVLSNSTICSCTDLMLTSALLNLSATFLKSRSISIANLTNPFHLYNLIAFFMILLRWSSIQLGICLMVTNSFFCWSDNKCGFCSQTKNISWVSKICVTYIISLVSSHMYTLC